MAQGNEIAYRLEAPLFTSPVEEHQALDTNACQLYVHYHVP